MINYTLEYEVITEIENLANRLEFDYLKSDGDCEMTEEYDEPMFHHQLGTFITKLRRDAKNLSDEFAG